MTAPTRRAAVVTLGTLTVLLYLVPIVVGYAVGAVPLRLLSSGILFEQSAVSLAGYRLIIWSPIVVGLFALAGALWRPPTELLVTLGVVAAAFAGTILLFGGVFGIGMGGTLLVGTDIRWIWKICCGFAGVALALVGPQLLKARAEDHDLDFRGIKRGILLGGFLAGALILLFAPGPMLGKGISGMGSWGGTLVWVMAL